MVLTTAFIQYQRAPEDPTIQSVLRQQDGQLLNARKLDDSYTLWLPGQKAASNGTVVLVHGLHDGVDISRSNNHWMTRLEQAILQRTASLSPEIILVDWREAAKPSGNPFSALDTMALSVMGMPKSAQDMLNDLSMIRPQGERIGELVGFKLARAIRSGDIARDKPLHLIGHSAGGFVVLHAALVLSELGLAPEPMQVTMLDTPFPLAADLAKAASYFPIDFYVTSSLAQGVPADQFVIGFKRFDITPPPEIDPYTGAHSYAHSWFIQSVSDKGNAEGFSRSPLIN
nr:alpha/beta hydrolase family protein [Shewanella ulleungensis]